MKPKNSNSFCVVCVILISCIFLFHKTYAQSGFLDQSFGDSGKVLIHTYGYCEALAIQNDGKLVMGGDGIVINEDTGQFIIRLFPDGLIDESFGEAGILILNFSQYRLGHIQDIKVQNDNKIISVSWTHSSEIMLNRFKENGELDSSFGTNGTVYSKFSPPVYINELQVQQDGKYVLAGFNIDNENQEDIVVLRYNPDGSFDESFGSDGKVFIDKYVADFANAVILQPDGKIIVGGGNSFHSYDRFDIIRLNANGSFDSSFGTNGSVTTDIESGEEYINSLTLQPDGKILATGAVHIKINNKAQTLSVTRYNSDGSIDESFGENGLASATFENGAEGKTVLLQPDGKIIVSGTAFDEDGNYSDPALARFKANGTLDSTFGINGIQVTAVNGGTIINDAALQQDEKIVLAGLNESDAIYYIALRYLNDEAMPLHFTYFNATISKDGIALNWQTAQENNNVYFAVERSSGNNFTEITKINSQGNSSQAQTYSYTDNAPLQGTNFYRLKQVDKDGKFSYSKIVSATLQNGLSVVLYPNPVKDVLNIKGLNAGMNYELSVMSAKDNVVAQTSVSNISSYTWNLQSLSKGVYYLTVTSNNLPAGSQGYKTTVKFVKQ